MPYVEDEALSTMYNPSVPIYDVTAQQFRETFVPLYTCPSDYTPDLIIPHSGPPSNGSTSEADPRAARYATGSYRGNAGRGDGRVTWYLYESLPPANGDSTPTGLHKGWRGPLHAVLRANHTSNPPLELTQESIKRIKDGTSKTLLAGESTNLFPRRRTFWAFTHGNYVLSQTTPYAPTLWGDWERCRALPDYGQSYRSCMSGWYSTHPGGMNGVRCDGSGTWIASDIDLQIWAAFGSMAGAENESYND
ncbi:MAG: DUF1559 domain-containing protein, partial [Planctomycetales bacterium]|nr:DUF1559 domain-containing protein [Planctomycetales bacterium]